MASPIPTALRPLPALRSLTATAIGLSMAAPTTALFGEGFAHADPTGTTLATLLCGALWAWLVLPDPRQGRAPKLTSFAVAIPLAILNASLSAASLFAKDGVAGHHLGDLASSLVGGALAGATFGVVYWVPGLVLTLLWFGLPLRAARAWARRGLDDAEAGLGLVAIAAAFPALGTVLVAKGTAAAALVGVVGTALTATLLALLVARRVRRAGYLRAVARGRVPGVRLEHTRTATQLVAHRELPEPYRANAAPDEVLLVLDEPAQERAVRAA